MMNNFLNFAANDFPFLSISELSSRFALPQAWTFHSSEGFGAYTLSILWNWPLQFVVGILAKFGFGHNLIIFITHILPIFIIGYFSINILLSQYKLKKHAKIIGSLVFLLNSYLLMVIDGGQFSIGLAYAFLPLVYISIVKAVGNNFNTKIKSSLLVILLGIFDIRFLFILFILISLHFLHILIKDFKSTTFNIHKWFYTGLVIGIIFSILNAYWILPAILSDAPALPSNYDSASQLSELSFANVGHAILFLHPHWYRNIFGLVTDLRLIFIFYPVAAFFGLLFLKKKNTTKVGFWLLVLTVSIVFVKGDNTPLNIYPWLFANVPGFSLFRDPTKFFVLIGVSYSVLIAHFVNKINKKIVYVVSIYIFILISPIWLRKTTGVFSSPEYIQEFNSINQIVDQDNSFGRILWLPSRHKYGYSSENHPAIEGLRIADQRPFATGRVGRYEQFNFIRDAEFMDQVFDVYGIEYIAFPKDTNRILKVEEEEYYATFSAQLAELEWLDPVYESDVVQLYRNENAKNKFFVTNKTIKTTRSDDIYSQLGEVQLSDNAVIFEDIFDNDKKISLAEKLPSSPDETGWWSRRSDFVWFRDFIEQKYAITNNDFDYGQGYAFAEGNLNLQVNLENNNPGRYLYARVLKNESGGKITFLQNDIEIGNIETKIIEPVSKIRKISGYKNIPDQLLEYTDSIFEWVYIGETSASDTLSIHTDGEFNVINALAISENLVNLEIEDIEFSTESNPASVEYTMINPTEYKINISGLDNLAMLVFAESFNNNWQLTSPTGQKISPVKVYDGLNGYEIEEDGEYILFFYPQKYVYQGLYVSIAGFVTLILYIMGYEYRKYKKASSH